MSDPYLSPRTALERSRGPRRRSSLGAVAIGGLGVDFLGTTVWAVLASLVVGIALAAGGASEDEVEAALGSAGFLLLLNAGGLGLSILGGYVAARFAGHHPLAHGAGSAALSLGLTLPLLSSADLLATDWTTMAGVVAQIPLGVLGGALAGRSLVEPPPPGRPPPIG